MVYRLVPKSFGPEQMVLGFGLGWRLFFGTLGALLAFGMIQERHVGIFPIIVTGILLLAAFYFDRWEFDRQSEVIAHSSGLLFAHRTKRYSLADLQEVLIRSPAQSSAGSPSRDGGLERAPGRTMNRGFTRLWLRFDEAGEVDIQMETSRNAGTLRDLGTEIARFCDVPYRDVGPA